MNFGGNITDPLDFKKTKVPALFEVDSLLRCHICKEFMTAPMLTSCGHSFCSMCVRKYLLHTPKCPICAKELRESHLSRNVLLEQVVLSYRDLRSDLLENLAVRKEEPQKRESQREESQSSNAEVIDLDEESDTPPVEYDDELQIIEETVRKRKPTTPPAGIEALFKRKKPEEKKSDVKMGVCPVCSKELPLQEIQTTHIDICLSAPQPTNFQPKEPEVTYQKLSKLDFSSLSNNALKAKLTKLELPTHGTRAQLEARYNEYLILWNSNCDSVAPRNPKVLRKQLAQWESTIKFKISNKSQLDKEGWNELIEQARKSLQKKKKADDVEKEIITSQKSEPISIPSQDSATAGTSHRFFD